VDRRAPQPDPRRARPRAPFDASWATETPYLVAEVLLPSTRGEDTLIKSAEYLAAGVEQYWILDLDSQTITVLGRTAAGWEVLADLDAARPAGTVEVDGHDVVLELTTLLAS
jgi:Uma2 family endonuclease